MPVSSEHRGRAGGEHPEPRVQLACTLVRAAHPEVRTRGRKHHEKVPATELREVVSARQRKGLRCGSEVRCRRRGWEPGRTQVASEGMAGPRDVASGCRGTQTPRPVLGHTPYGRLASRILSVLLLPRNLSAPTLPPSCPAPSEAQQVFMKKWHLFKPLPLEDDGAGRAALEGPLNSPFPCSVVCFPVMWSESAR